MRLDLVVLSICVITNGLLFLAIIKNAKNYKKKIDKEINEKEQEFIYEYPELSVSSIKNLSKQIVELKYKWIEYDKNII